MAESVVAEIRQLLQDVIAPDLKAIFVRMDGLQKQMELSEKSVAAQLDAFRAELGAFRLELNAFRVEQSAFRNEVNAFRAEMRSEFQAQRNLVQNEVLRETGPIRERLVPPEARHA
jgi:hypothetical protein